MTPFERLKAQTEAQVAAMPSPFTGPRQTDIVRSCMDGELHCGYCDGRIWRRTCADPACQGHEPDTNSGGNHAAR